LVEVCTGHVTRLFEAALETPVPGLPGEAAGTAPFLGVSRRADGLWALGVDGIYRLDGGGVGRVHPLPQQFRTVGHVRVSFELPGFVVVMANVGRRPSPVGSAALLVAR
jgi:hypothetical protein